MVIPFTFVIPCDIYFDYFIYNDTTLDYSQLSLPRPTESKSNISIYFIIYLFIILCSSYLQQVATIHLSCHFRDQLRLILTTRSNTNKDESRAGTILWPG